MDNWISGWIKFIRISYPAKTYPILLHHWYSVRTREKMCVAEAANKWNSSSLYTLILLKEFLSTSILGQVSVSVVIVSSKRG